MLHPNLTERYRELKRFAKINPRQTSSLKNEEVCRTAHNAVQLLDLSELERCISSISVSTLKHVKDLFPNLILEDLSRTLTVLKKKFCLSLKMATKFF